MNIFLPTTKEAEEQKNQFPQKVKSQKKKGRFSKPQQKVI
jgi:hypothetical protein